MGISPIDPMSVVDFVSDLDPGFNKIVSNQAELDVWDKLDDAGREGKLKPEPVFAHDPKATVWKVGCLDSIVMGLLADDMTAIGGGGQLVIRTAENEILAARLALRGWTHSSTKFETVKHDLKGFEYDILTEEAAKTIPLPVLRQIGRRAREANSVDKVTAKNSG